MAINKVTANNTTLLDLTGDDLTNDTSKVLSGYKYHGRDGIQYTGTASHVTQYSITKNITNGYATGATVTYPDSTGVSTTATVTIRAYGSGVVPLTLSQSSIRGATVSNYSVNDTSYSSEGVITLVNATDNVVINVDCYAEPALYLTFTSTDPFSFGFTDDWYPNPTATSYLIVCGEDEYVESGYSWRKYFGRTNAYNSDGKYILKIAGVGITNFQNRSIRIRDKKPSGGSGSGSGSGSGDNSTVTEEPGEFLGTICCTGCIDSLLDWRRLDAGLSISRATNTFNQLFSGCSYLTSTPTFTEHNLVQGECRAMFRSCTSLTTAPILPSRQISVQGYDEMFMGCTSLETAPELPALIIAQYGYRNMFCDCTSLRVAPTILPATGIAASGSDNSSIAACAYQYMFTNCSSLVTPPKIAAVTSSAPYKIFFHMFSGCTSLSSLPALYMTTYEADSVGGTCWCMFQDCPLIKISDTQHDEYVNEYRLPMSGTGTAGGSTPANVTHFMFASSSGGVQTNVVTPDLNTIYYTPNSILTI